MNVLQFDPNFKQVFSNGHFDNMPAKFHRVNTQHDHWTTVFVKSCDSFTRVIHNEVITQRHFPHYWRFWGANNGEFWYSCNWSEWTAEQAVELLMIWDTMTLIWRYCNFHYYRANGKISPCEWTDSKGKGLYWLVISHNKTNRMACLRWR